MPVGSWKYSCTVVMLHAAKGGPNPLRLVYKSGKPVIIRRSQDKSMMSVSISLLSSTMRQQVQWAEETGPQEAVV